MFRGSITAAALSLLLAACGGEESVGTGDAARGAGGAGTGSTGATGEAGVGGTGAQGTGGGGTGGAGATGENVPGEHDVSIDVDGQARTFIVYVPELAADQVAPVVFMLHGTGGDGRRFLEHSGWREKADEEGMIVVFPDALDACFFEDDNHDGDFDDAGERKVTTKWSSGQVGDAFPVCSPDDIAQLPADKRALVDHPVADDLAFFDAMVASLSEQQVIDAKAIYVTGFSNGGQMSARLAMERSEVLAAVHAAAGTLTIDAVATRDLSMIFSVGSLDDRFTAAAGLPELPMTEEGLASLPLFQGIVGAYLNGLRLDAPYTFDGNANVARFTFESSLVGAGNSLQAVVIAGLPHQYPNGQNHPVSAADTLWPFFEAHRLP